ncbi:MAG TPA: amino acid ABC transporter substrate-binding protein, partial [Marinobacter adhaerens]|nr:amino acid ABC transporter substrate-binding protein [Marinobacter adhaerens]
MHLTVVRLWILLVGLLFTSASLGASESVNKTLRIAYVEFPPITYQASDGRPAGSFIELT